MSNYIEIINGRKNKINLIGDIVGNSYSQSLTYKSIDCDYNTLTNITPSNIKSSALAIGAGDNDKLTTKGYVSDLISLNLTAYIKLQGDWDVINNNPDITGTTNVGFAWKVYNASEGQIKTVFFGGINPNFMDIGSPSGVVGDSVYLYTNGTVTTSPVDNISGSCIQYLGYIVNESSIYVDIQEPIFIN